MKEFLSHYSAAKAWQIPYHDSIFGSDPAGGAAATTEVTVSGGRGKSAKESRFAHSCELELPRGAVVELDGTRIASPELTFLQMAGRLNIHRLVLLGLQMCSHSVGVPSEAITSKAKLTAFLERASGHRGWRNAKRALRYIENGSASLMESLVYMMLVLPHSLGGYGLGGAVFNYEIKLDDEAAMRLGQSLCFLDLYYKKANLGVEYDSFAFHHSPKEQGKDALRSAVLERQGIEVMRISTIQAYDPAAFKVTALNLAVRLGKRMQIRTSRFEDRCASLRKLLPVRPSEYGQD